MKLAIVGKGGSGKSTVSWLLTKYLSEKNNKVLAIDADYNMDLSSNLNFEETKETTYLKDSEKDFYNYQELTDKDMYVDLPKKDNLKHFSFPDKDSFTRKYAHEINSNIDLMIFGGAHEDLYFGHRCSHAYISSLKYYLPLLDLSKNEFLIIDSVAGTDMVNYGLYLGVDAILCVVEPTRNSQKVAKQIESVSKILKIPIFFIGNKGESENFDTITTLPIDEGLITLDYEKVNQKTKESLHKLLEELSAKNFVSEDQWIRHKIWRTKYEEQLTRKTEEPFSFISVKGGS